MTTVQFPSRAATSTSSAARRGGMFASFEALVALLQQLVADSRRRRS